METFGTLDTETAEAVATAEKSGTATPKVVGKGIYLELIKPNPEHIWDKETIQIIITPAGVDEKGKAVPVAFTYRAVGKMSPRRQWQTKHHLPKDEKANPTEITADLVEKVVASVVRQGSYGYSKLQGKLVVEVSNIDLSNIREHETPSALIRRITKARTDAGFPVDVYLS